MVDREKVVRALECCILRDPDDHARCSQCSYGSNCVNRLKMDALALLKAQEARVMTLDEVKGSIGEAIYFESRGTYMGKIVFPILPALFTPHGLMRYVHPQSSHFSELGLHDYGKVWRCWTSRPTDEQREAVKWDG